MAVVVINFIYVALFVPESMPSYALSSSTDVESQDKAPSTADDKSNLSFYQQLKYVNKNPIIRKLIFLKLAGDLNNNCQIIINMQYMGARYGFTSGDVRTYLGVTGLFIVLSQLVILPSILKYYPNLTRLLMYISVLTYGSQSIWFGLATEKWMIYPGVLLHLFTNCWSGLNSSLLSQETPPSEQGMVQGVANALSYIACAFGIQVFGLMFFYVQNTPLIGLPLITSGCLVVITTFYVSQTIPPSSVDTTLYHEMKNDTFMDYKTNMMNQEKDDDENCSIDSYPSPQELLRKNSSKLDYSPLISEEA
jgi:hypothetical protein